MKGWGPKSSACPSKPRESNFFGGISRDFAGISRKRPKSLRKKYVWVQFLSPRLCGMKLRPECEQNSDQNSDRPPQTLCGPGKRETQTICPWLSGTESRIANRTIPGIAGLESPEIEKRKYELNRSKVESQKIDSESPSESHPIKA